MILMHNCMQAMKYLYISWLLVWNSERYISECNSSVKVMTLQNNLLPRGETRIWQCRSLEELLYNGCDPVLVSYPDELCFRLCECVHSHSDRYWCTENSHLVCEVPLRNMKIRVLELLISRWCVCCEETVNSEQCIRLIKILFKSTN
jgi:hypothetical protein